MSASRQTAPMTVAEFLPWSAPDGSERWELMEGAPRAMAPSSPRHGAIAAQIARLLGNHLVASQLECRVVVEPGVQPRVRADINVRIPDLGVTCTSIRSDDRLLREPVVLIEILSPSNAADTWANVWAYTTIPSVHEVLVVHVAEERADLLTRQSDGTWPENPVQLTAGDDVVLASIGFTVPLGVLYP